MVGFGEQQMAPKYKCGVIDGLTQHGIIISPHLSGCTIPYVTELIQHDSRAWKMDIIKETLLIEADIIGNIPLTRRNIPDKLIWPYEKSCDFTVRSGYHWIRRQNTNGTTQSSGM